MSRVRQGTCRRVQDALGDACMAWSPDTGASPLQRYTARYGVAHLLASDRTEDTERRMLDLFFMAAFTDAWETVVEPLTAWRVVGSARAEAGFSAAVDLLPAADIPPEPDLIEAAATTTRFLREAGLFRPGVRLAEWTVLARTHRFGADHPSTMFSVNELALLHQSGGRYAAAEPLLIRAVEVRERTLGASHFDTLVSLSSLGLLYQHQGRYADAEALFVRILQCCHDTLGSENPETLTSANNLANLYESQARYDEAETLYEKTLAAKEKTLGPDHPDTMVVVNNLAVLRLSMRRFADAETLCRRAHEGFVAAFGPLHPSTLTALDNLASLYHYQGRHDDSEALYRRALEGRERALGPEHPSTLDILQNLARLYESQERYDAAEELYRRTLEGRQRALGPEHPRTLLTRYCLGDVLLSLERPAEALEQLHRTLAGEVILHGADHPALALTHWILARCLRKLDRPAEAAVHRRRCWALETARDGGGASGTLQTALALGKDLQAAEATSDAVEVLHAALAAAATATEPDEDRAHRVDQLRNHLARLYKSRGQHQEASALYLQTLHARQEALGDTHSKTLITRYRLGRVLLDAGRLEEALDQLERTLAGEIALHGPDDPELALTHWHLARCLRKLDRPADAAVHRRRCWALETARDGGGASGTLQTAVALARDLHAAEDVSGAQAVVQQALAAAAGATGEDGDRVEWVEALRALEGP